MGGLAFKIQEVQHGRSEDLNSPLQATLFLKALVALWLTNSSLVFWTFECNSGIFPCGDQNENLSFPLRTPQVLTSQSLCQSGSSQAPLMLSSTYYWILILFFMNVKFMLSSRRPLRCQNKKRGKCKNVQTSLNTFIQKIHNNNHCWIGCMCVSLTVWPG